MVFVVRPSEPNKINEDHGPAATVHRIVDWCALNLKKWLKIVSFSSSLIGSIVGICAGANFPKSGESWTGTVWLLIVFGLCMSISAACTWALDSSRRGQERGQIAAKVAAYEQLREAVIPSLRSVSKLSSLPDSARTEQLAKMVSQVMQSRPVIFGGISGARMVIYRVEIREGKKHLEIVDFGGRAVDKPSPFAEESKGRGSKVFVWLYQKSPKTYFVENTENEPKSAWQGSGNGYRTFISVPIYAGEGRYGMLTLDAPNPGDLAESHIPILEVLAHILATAFVLSPKA